MDGRQTRATYMGRSRFIYQGVTSIRGTQPTNNMLCDRLVYSKDSIWHCKGARTIQLVFHCTRHTRRWKMIWQFFSPMLSFSHQTLMRFRSNGYPFFICGTKNAKNARAQCFEQRHTYIISGPHSAQQWSKVSYKDVIRNDDFDRVFFLVWRTHHNIFCWPQTDMSQPNKLHRTFLPDWLIDFRRIISTPTSGPRFSISGMCQCGLHHTLLTKAKVHFAQFLFSMFAEVKDRAHAVSISHFRTCYLERFVGVWAWLDFPKTGMLRGVC